MRLSFFCEGSFFTTSGSWVSACICAFKHLRTALNTQALSQSAMYFPEYNQLEKLPDLSDELYDS